MGGCTQTRTIGGNLQAILASGDGSGHRLSFRNERWHVQEGRKQRFALIQALSWWAAKSEMEPIHMVMIATKGSRFGVGSPFGTLACAWVTGHHRMGL